MHRGRRTGWSRSKEVREQSRARFTSSSRRSKRNKRKGRDLVVVRLSCAQVKAIKIIINLASRFRTIWSNLSDLIRHVWHDQGKKLIYETWQVNLYLSMMTEYATSNITCPCIGNKSDICFLSLHYQTTFSISCQTLYQWPIISQKIGIQLLDQPVFLWLRAGLTHSLTFSKTKKV